MLTRKTLVVLAALLVIASLMILASWSPATVAAQGPAPAATPRPPVAVLQVLAVPGNAADKNAITATVEYITDTAVGKAKSAVALYSTGGSNVPINVPVKLSVSAADPKVTGKPVWTLTAPPGSKAAFKDPASTVGQFTPDVVGAYMVSVTLKGDTGTSAPKFATFTAGTYIGVTAGNCKTCHVEQTAEWAKTGHADVFSDSLDNKRDGPNKVATHYAETCIRCHVTGYYPAPFGGAGGFEDVAAKAKWVVPTFKQIDDAWAKKGPSNWDNAPADVKNMGNIQCEVCHGPASEHVKNSAKVMEASFENGVCNQCHAGGGHHIKGTEITFSKHSEETSMAWTYPTGPAEQSCVRCHSGKGYASFLKTPKNMAAWNNEPQTVGCATCHDPHSEANSYQLRIVGKPIDGTVPFTPKDVGLSATCFECHNNGTKPEEALKGNFPHYPSDAELLSDTGGVTYGQTVPNSPHGAMIGAAPMKNPAYDGKDPTVNQFMFSKAGDAKGNTPGSCIVCHMSAGLTDAKDPNYMKVGEHSFNTVSPDGKLDYGASCKSCHGDVKDFDMKAKADYDGNGKVEGVQTEVKGLLNVLWKQLETKGVKKMDSGYPYATLPKGADGNVDAKIANAWYNYRVVYGPMWGAAGAGNEGKASAIHNLKRSVALLQLSIKDLSGGLPGGMSELK